MTESRIVIRPCQGLDEMRACVGLQKEVWNFTDIELVPLRMFVVAEKIGGQVIGAFDQGQIVGFAFSLERFLRCQSRDIALATPIAIPTCWQCVAPTVTPVWAAYSS